MLLRWIDDTLGPQHVLSLSLSLFKHPLSSPPTTRYHNITASPLSPSTTNPRAPLSHISTSYLESSTPSPGKTPRSSRSTLPLPLPYQCACTCMVNISLAIGIHGSLLPPRWARGWIDDRRTRKRRITRCPPSGRSSTVKLNMSSTISHLKRRREKHVSTTRVTLRVHFIPSSSQIMPLV